MPRQSAPLGSLFCIASLALLCACGGGDQPPRPAAVAAPTVRAILYDARECRSLPGELRSKNSVTLSSKISGTVVEVLAAEGQVVERGQAILRIDDTELKQRVEAVQSTAEQAGLERQALAARAAHARVNLERMRKLFAQQAISRDELDRAATEFQALRKQEQALAASAAAAGHQRAEARSLMGYSVVAAPFRGVLSRRYVDQGAFVSAGAPLAAIDDVQGGYELEAQADESLMRQVAPGMQVLGLVPSLSPQPFVTRLTAVVGRVDPATRTFKLKAAYEGEGQGEGQGEAASAANATADATPGAAQGAAQGDPPGDPAATLVPAQGPSRPHAGMFGKVCVPVARARKLLIPAQAVRPRGELATVLVVDQEGVLRLRLVKLGGAYLKAELDGQSFIVQAGGDAPPGAGQGGGLLEGALFEVLSGLAEGEEIVAGGPDTLREGDRLARGPERP